MDCLLHFTLLTEKIPNRGEDAPPTLEVMDDDAGILAVYDGLGGSGSTPYQIESGIGEKITVTGAYLASRLAKEVTEQYFAAIVAVIAEVDTTTVEDTTDWGMGLENSLKVSFRAMTAELDPHTSKLKSRLLKRLPTTLAGIYFEQDAINRQLHTTSFWAGDSRVFFLEKSGLIQISQDDLNGNPDALENLKQDATIANCVNAEGNFNIRAIYHTIDEPCLLITATDGCFGYVASPAHFEYILLKTLMESQYDMEDWRDRLLESLLSITGDDMSMSLLAWGFRNLNEIKNYFYARYRFVYQQFIQPIEKADLESKADLLKQLWAEYRQTYYLNNIVE
jgi:serine/threonine protein phosphatase PrpC